MGLRLEHRHPIKIARMIGTRSRRRHRAFHVRGKRCLCRLDRWQINIQLASCVSSRLHEVRTLLGFSHPGGSLMQVALGEAAVTLTAAQTIDRRHRIAEMLLLFRESGLMARSHCNPVHGSFPKRSSGNAIGGRERATDISLNWLCGTRCLSPFQMRMRMRQVTNTRRIAAT